MPNAKEVRILTEAAALRELKKGSEAALCWFIDAYTPYVTAIIHGIIGDHMDMADVEEVASDVFYALWENARKVYSVKGYLGTMARNKAENKLRSLDYDLPLEEQVLVLEGGDPEEKLEEKERKRAVRWAVLQMPHPEKEIFLRHYYYCQKVDTISREMNLPLSTVKTKLRRGRARLGRELQKLIT